MSSENKIFAKFSHNGFLVSVFTSATNLKLDIADRIRKLIQKAAETKTYINIGLATGSTPIGVYNELVRFSQQEKLDCTYVNLFQLDDYFGGLPNTATQSFQRFLREYLLKRIPSLREKNCFFLDSSLSHEKAKIALELHLARLHEYAPDGFDYLLLGVGENAHLICAEPETSREDEITFCELHETTAAGAAASFFDREFVPTHWGGFSLKTIMRAKRVDAMILVEKKAKTFAEIILGEDSEKVPASILRDHENAEFLSDAAAAAKLPQIEEAHRYFESPSSLKNWMNPACIKRAVSWASFNSQTPLRDMSSGDFNRLGLDSMRTLLEASVKEITSSVYENYASSVRENPGEYFYPGLAPKDAPAINIWSPHPDDDVIACGAMMKKLTADGYKVNVIYGTGGNIAVTHKTLLSVLKNKELLSEVISYARHPSEIDLDSLATDIELDLEYWDRYHNPYSRTTRLLSGLIRRKEATEAAMSCGVKKVNIYFADFSFYQTGTVLKREPGEKDFGDAYEIICLLKAGIDIAGGDVSDPNGTHGKVLSIISHAWKQYDDLRLRHGLPKRRTFLYRVAWATWAPHVFDLVFPFNAATLKSVEESVKLHYSQRPLRFQGTDPLSIEERAVKVRCDYAKVLQQLGVLDSSYAGAEVLYEWDGITELSLVM